jgi:hypothetical protein
MRGAWAAIFAAALVAMAFLPTSFTNHDEYYYGGQAYTLSKGRLTPQPTDPLFGPLSPPANAFRYPIAWPAVLALGRLVSIRAMYLVALAVHLVGGVAVARMLVRRGGPSALTAAYLFHPVFWIYSRTLMSDGPTTAALLIAMDAWENRSSRVAAGALGFAGAVRLANVTALAGFGLGILGESRRRFADIAGLLLGVGAFWSVQLLVNHTLSGHWLMSSYAAQGAGMFNGKMATENIVLYVCGLALLPPFSLICALAHPRRVDRWVWIAVTVVVAYVPVSYHNVSASILETLVGGQRYVMPAHAALLISTARLWSGVPLFRRPWLPIGAGIVVAVVVCLRMAPIERRHSLAASAVASCHPEWLAYSREANLVAGSVEARSYQAFDEIPSQRSNWDVAILTPGYQGNQPGFSSPWLSAPPSIPGAECRLIGVYAIYDFTGHCPPQGQPCVFNGPR